MKKHSALIVLSELILFLHRPVHGNKAKGRAGSQNLKADIASSLSNFFESTGGSKSWKRRDNWNSEDVDACEWYGIMCDEFGTIFEVNLEDNGLIGNPSADIYRLPNLQSLILRNNNLQIIFEGMENAATTLQKLDISDTAPYFEMIGIEHATNLRYLDISNTQLDHIFPTQIVSLTNLEVLKMSRNNMSDTKIPTEIGQLSNLKEFNCVDSGLAGEIPNELMSALTHLQHLDLSMNALSGTISNEATSNLSNLQTLNLHSNKLHGNLPSLSLELPRLRKLDLSFNHFSGPIPKDFLEDNAENAHQSELVEINLAGNMLTGSLPHIGFYNLNINVAGNKIESIEQEEVTCAMALWNDGNVGQFSCNAILCPPQTFNPSGMQTSVSDPCEACPTSKYYGSTECSEVLPSSCDLVCYNGGICDTNPLVTDHFCKCQDGFSGKQCEFSTEDGGSEGTLEGSTTTPQCTPECLNDGVCILSDTGKPTCDCKERHFGKYCQYKSLDLDGNNDTPEVCPDGHRCFNRGKCLENVAEKGTYRCDCVTKDGIPYAGLFCEYQATDVCTGTASLSRFGEGRSLRVRSENGMKRSLLDLTPHFCTNGGTCKPSASNSIGAVCVCPDTFEGDKCQFEKGGEFVQVEVCPDATRCHNGGTCVKVDGAYKCDCSGAIVDGTPHNGLTCENRATVICSTEPPYESYCTNGGTCILSALPGEDHSGCICPSDRQGAYCELLNEKSSNQDSHEKIRYWMLLLIAIGGPLVVFIVIGIAYVVCHKQKRRATETGTVDDNDETETEKYAGALVDQASRSNHKSNPLFETEGLNESTCSEEDDENDEEDSDSSQEEAHLIEDDYNKNQNTPSPGDEFEYVVPEVTSGDEQTVLSHIFEDDGTTDGSSVASPKMRDAQPNQAEKKKLSAAVAMLLKVDEVEGN